MTSRKRYVELSAVTEFMVRQADAVNIEYAEIVGKLEAAGMLEMPFAEKIQGKNLFAMRVIHAGNVRIFYVYGTGDSVFGIHAYEKKTRSIPEHEMKRAVKILKAMRQEGLVK